MLIYPLRNIIAHSHCLIDPLPYCRSIVRRLNINCWIPLTFIEWPGSRRARPTYGLHSPTAVRVDIHSFTRLSVRFISSHSLLYPATSQCMHTDIACCGICLLVSIIPWSLRMRSLACRKVILKMNFVQPNAHCRLISHPCNLARIPVLGTCQLSFRDKHSCCLSLSE